MQSDFEAPISSIEEQLSLLRDFTNRTGVVHEAQLLQLKMWPGVWFDRHVTSKCSIDQEKKKLSYDVLVSSRAETDDELAEKLSRCVKWLFGDTWAVTVNVLTRGRKRSRHKKVFRF